MDRQVGPLRPRRGGRRAAPLQRRGLPRQGLGGHDGGSFSIVEENEPLDSPLHVHEREDEIFYVLAGEHVFTVGDEEFRAGPGELVYGPRTVPHAQGRVVPRAGRTLTMCSPAGFEGFFRELSEAEAAGTIGPEVYARVSARYGITWL